ncbi:MAG: LysR family transcriptional regulator [Sandaracinaceae bacterium]
MVQRRDLRGLIGRMLVFERVAALGSFTAAARDLGIARSAVSAAVATLEEEMKVRLLHRTTRTVVTTDVGRRLEARCRRIADEGLEALEEVFNEAGLAAGQLRVTAPAGPLAMRVIVPVLAALKQQHQVSADLRISDGRLDVVADEVDVAIRIGTPKRLGLVMKKLTASDHILVATPALAARFATKSALADAPFVLHRDISPRIALRSPSGRRTTIEPTDVVLVNDAPAMMELIRCGAGVGSVPALYANEDLAAGRLVRLLPRHRGRSATVFALIPSRRQLPLRTRLFLDAVHVRIRDIGM